MLFRSGVNSDISFPNPFSTPDIGENHLDNSLPPDSIPNFVSNEANEGSKWEPVRQSEIDRLKDLSKDRVAKSKDFQEIVKELKEVEERKGLVRLAEMRKKEGENKKKNKDKAPKLVAKERNKPQIDEALNILGDFVNLRSEGSGKLVTQHTSGGKN